MRAQCIGITALALLACDPTVKIGDPDGGTAGGSSTAGGSTAGGATGGGSAGGGGSGGASAGGTAGTDPFCSDLSAAVGDFLAGHSSCSGGTTVIVRGDVVLCNDHIQPCDSADRQKLAMHVACINAAPRCATGNETAAVSAFMACVSTTANAVSAACRNSLFTSRPAGKVVFITSTTHRGSLGGLSGANALCQTVADGANLGGTFVAWLSSSTVDAIDRINDIGPWTDMKGAALFASKASITASGPSTAIWYDERGRFLSSDRVWTATGPNGRFLSGGGMPPCANWTSMASADLANVGQVGRMDTAWTNQASTTCDQSARLLCFEQ